MRLNSKILTIILIFLPTVTLAEMMSVGFSGAEMRSRPYAMDSQVIKQVAQFAPLAVLEKGPDYFKVRDYDGATGWVHHTLLNSSSGVTVTSDKANVRSGPGTGHDVVFQLSRGDTARLLNRSDKWLEIETPQGQKGWVAAFLVWGE